MNEKLGLAETEMLLKLNNEMDEKLERIKKKNNLITFGMKESINESSKERLKVDTNKVERLLKELEVTVSKIIYNKIGEQN